jgi:hypothetical protein
MGYLCQTLPSSITRLNIAGCRKTLTDDSKFLNNYHLYCYDKCLIIEMIRPVERIRNCKFSYRKSKVYKFVIKKMFKFIKQKHIARVIRIVQLSITNI